MTAAATTGPAQGPRPTSSIPQTGCGPALSMVKSGATGRSSGTLVLPVGDPMPPRITGVSDETSCKCASEAFDAAPPLYRLNEDSAEVVHVRKRRTGDDLVAQGFEEAAGIIRASPMAGSKPAACAPASVSGVTIAPATSAAPSTPSVSQASPKIPGGAVQGDREGEAELGNRTPTPSPRRVTVHSPPNRSTVGQSAPVRVLRASLRLVEGEGARLAVEGVAEQAHGATRRLCRQRPGSGGDDAVFGSGEAGRVGPKHAGRGGENGVDRGGHSDGPAREDRASGVEVPPTVGPEAISAGSSPGTSDIISESTRAGQAAAASCPPSPG